MGDSDESVFWDGREEEYGGIFSSHDNFQTNLLFETENLSMNFDDDSNSKRISVSPDSDHQEAADGDSSSSQSSPLGLTLSKTPSFLDLLQSSLSKGKKPADSSTPQTHDNDNNHNNINNNNINNNKPRRKVDDMVPEKLKASNFPAFCLKIGSWQRVTRHEGDLTAKLYYAKRKLVWEILEGALKCKIEVQWSDISAIRATMPENELGSLEIELNQPPMFYREINPQPRKHTLWQQSSDFTGGQAPVCRKHYVTFPTGVLDKHYEKLLQCDERLLALSQKPFPANHTPYFDPNMYGITQLSLMLKNTTTNTHISTYPSPYMTSYPQSSTMPPAMDGTYHHYQQPNIGMLNDVDHSFIGAGSSMSMPMDENHYYGAYQLDQNNNNYYNDNNVTSNDVAMDQFNQNFAQPPQYWQMPPEQDVSRLLMEQQQQIMMSNSSTFVFPGDNVPTTGTGGYY